MTFETYSQQLKQQSLGRGCVSGLVSFKQSISALTDATQSSKNSEILMSETAQDQQSPFSKIMGELLGNQTDAIESFLGTDIDSVDGLVGAVGTALDTIIDPSGAGDALLTTAVASVGAPLGSIGALSPASRNLLVSKTIQKARGECGSKTGVSLLSTSWGGVKEAAGQLKQSATDLSNSVKAYAAAAGSGKGFGDGLKRFVANSFKLGLKNELITLKRISTVVTQLNKAVAALKESDYTTNHPALIRMARNELSLADGDLDSLIRILTTGGTFDGAAYESAKQHTKTAELLLKGDYWNDLFKIFPTTRMLRVVILYLELRLLVDTFESQSATNRSNAAKFFEFDLNFVRKTPGIDVLYAPIVAAIRCRLQRTIEDMDETLTKDQLLLFLMKEKQWYLEVLITLRVFSAMKLFDSFKDALKSADLIKKLNFQVELDNGRISTSYSGTVDRETVIGNLRRYLYFVQKKININTLPDTVIAYGDLSLFEVSTYIKERPSFHGALFVEVFGSDLPDNVRNIASALLSNPIEEAISRLDSDAIQGIALAQAYFEVLSGHDSDMSAEALANGDFDTFFSFDSVINNLAQRLKEQSALLIDCLSTQPTQDRVAIQSARQNYLNTQEQIRASSIWRDIYYNSHERHVQTTILTDLNT